MTSPGEANVVPIALVLDGRTGYTIWAAPWIEDGEEWQAFLGAGSRVFVFEDLDGLETFLGSGAENDLSDHPSWTMLKTLPAEQLAPETDYYFDLDEVPGLTEGEPDDEVVMRIGDTIDMVQRIAECCDDGALLHLLESPAFAALLDEELASESDLDDDIDDTDSDDDPGAGDGADASVEDEDTPDGDGELADDEDNPWAEIGEAVRTAWPLVSGRVDKCLRWFAPGEQPERVVPEPGEESASANAPTDNAADDPADNAADAGDPADAAETSDADDAPDADSVSAHPPA